MLRLITEKEEKQNMEELKKFCEDNSTEMWNYMGVLKSARWEIERQVRAEVKVVKKKVKRKKGSTIEELLERVKGYNK